jgi:hypothetical protein
MITEALADQPVFRHGTTTADLATINSGNAGFDPRGPTNNSTCIVSSQTAVTIPALGAPNNAFWSQFLGANSFGDVITTDIQELPLLPGDAYQMLATTLNQRAICSFMWRERLLEESERT